MKINETALDALMVKQGLTGKELAARMGVSPSVISLIRSRSTARHETIRLLAEALGVEPERIMA